MAAILETESGAGSAKVLCPPSRQGARSFFSFFTAEERRTGTPFARWAGELPGVVAASTLEVAYANADGKAVTDRSARALGRDLARALHTYRGPAWRRRRRQACRPM